MLGRSLTHGFAIFSMFFGAGNVVFPLIVGQHTQSHLPLAMLGLILTAVLVPFSGLIGITLFNGDYEAFFKRCGKWPGFIIMCLVLALIGPFGGIPRCVTLTFSTLKVYVPQISLLWFSASALFVVFLCCLKQSRVVSILGKCLTPLLLSFLVFLVIKGLFFTSHGALSTTTTPPEAFFHGLKEGYNTMDLLAAFFFSSIICREVPFNEKSSILKSVLKASLIGAILLTITYFSFGFLAALHGEGLNAREPDMWLGRLGMSILGPRGGIVVSMIVALSCLTTAIALAVTCSTFLHEKLFKKRISYGVSLCLIGLMSFGMSTLGFTGIVKALATILQVAYPVLLALTLVNIVIQLRKRKLQIN